MSYTYSESVTLEADVCITCGVTYAMPSDLKKRRREDHGWFYCPNGHAQHFSQQSEAERLKSVVEKEQREAASLRERAVAAERAQKRAEQSLTRHKKRAAAGVCPCCNRTVKQLSDHMKSKHSDFMQLQGVTPPKQLAEKVQ